MADTWPRAYHPIHDGVIDWAHTVQVYPHLAEGAAKLQAWCGGAGDIIDLVNGGPVYIVPSNRPCAERLVGLGDVVIETLRDDHTRRYDALPGGDISAHLWPADVPLAPPAD